jgi:hypothetical protein
MPPDSEVWDCVRRSFGTCRIGVRICGGFGYELRDGRLQEENSVQSNRLSSFQLIQLRRRYL